MWDLAAYKALYAEQLERSDDAEQVADARGALDALEGLPPTEDCAPEGTAEESDYCAGFRDALHLMRAPAPRRLQHGDTLTVPIGRYPGLRRSG